MIPRPRYQELLSQYRDINLIKIVTGVRRCGKSTLFRLFQQDLLQFGIEQAQIQSINLEELGNESLLDYHRLHDHIVQHLIPGKQNYIFLDEIQNVRDFQRAVRSLTDRGGVDLYLTGSNSKLQSGEWATSIAGRYVEIQMFPLSFREYASAHPEVSNPEELFETYAERTSFPQGLSFPEPVQRELTGRYLDDLYNSIVLKDVMENKGISEVERLNRIIRFLSSAVGSEISVKKIADTLSSDGLKMTPPTVESYLRALQDCFLFYKVYRYDLKGRKLLKTLNKYYIVDAGLRYRLLGGSNRDSGHVLENIVYLELRRRGYQVSIGKLELWQQGVRRNIEIDFVATRGDETSYYQVCEDIRDASTRERELAPLLAVRDHYPKYLLTRGYSVGNVEGVRHLNVIKWLLGEI